MRTLLSCLCLALALLLGAVPAARAELTVCSAGCDVPNIIDSDRTWKAATYRVQEHIQNNGASGLRFVGPPKVKGGNEGQTLSFTFSGRDPGVRFSVTNGTYTDSKEIAITVVDVP